MASLAGSDLAPYGARMADVDDLAIVALVDAERARAAAADRRARGWLARLDAEQATFAGLLVDLAEQHAEVVIEVAGQGRCQGRVDAVGVDHVVLAGRAHRWLISWSAIATVRPTRSELAHATPRRGGAPAGQPIMEALRGLVAERTPVTVRGVGGDPTEGQLVAAGADLITVRTASGALVHLPLHGLAVVQAG